MISLQIIISFILLGSIATSSMIDENTKLSHGISLQERGDWGGLDGPREESSVKVENGIKITKANVVVKTIDDGLKITRIMEMQTTYDIEPIVVVSQKPIDFGQTVEESFIFYPPSGEDVNVYVVVGKDFPGKTRLAWKTGAGKNLVNSRFNDAIDSDYTPQQVKASKAGFVKGRIAFAFGSTFTTTGVAQSDRHRLMMKMASDLAREKGGQMVIMAEKNGAGHIVDPDSLLFNNLDRRATQATSSEPETLVKPVLLKSFAVSKRGSQLRPAQIATLVDISNSATISKRATSDTTLQQFTTEISSSPQQPSSSSTSAAAQFNEILAAYQSVQANISNAIFPILVDMTSKTNSSLIFEAARSIWIDLVSPSEASVGPFSQGFHCLDDLMDYQAKQLNLTVSDPAFQIYVAIGAILLDVYKDAWSRAYTAVNQSGLLSQLDTLGSKLLINSNNTIAPATFFQPSNNTYDDSFFTDFDRNKDLDKLLL